jgi:cytochrome oxidase Cu insertion factor (SCO1/SenC/PrrC family)
VSIASRKVSKLLVVAGLIGGTLLGAAGGLLVPGSLEQERSAAELMDIVMWGREPIGGPFALVDHNGQPRSDADFRGKLLLIYFGFTACSDVCPTDLHAIAGALDRLGPLGEAVQPLFITVNPEMDTPEHLKNYVGLFHPRIIGLTGERRRIREVARAYKVYFAKTTSELGDDPNVDHGALMYLVDADGHYVGFLPPGTSADRMTEVLRPRLVDR